MSLCLDIGGTNFRIAEIKDMKILRRATFPTQNADAANIINDFNRGSKEACIAFAGPITGRRAHLTNNDLSIDADHLEKKTGLKIHLLNDFHAAGYGIDFIEDKEVLHKGKAFNDNAIVIGPGTGLGKAYITKDEVHASEAGYTALPAHTDEEYELLQSLDTHYYEDVVSGRGIFAVFSFLQSSMDVPPDLKKEIEAAQHKAEIISAHKHIPLCKKTLSIFSRFYGRFVRDSVLHLLSSKVYLIGGISRAMDKDAFLKEYLDHSAYAQLLKQVTIYRVKSDSLGLLGAANYMRKRSP